MIRKDVRIEASHHSTDVGRQTQLSVAILLELAEQQVEEMTKTVLESGMLQEANEHYELTGTLASLAIPATLQDSLMARLSRARPRLRQPPLVSLFGQ